MISISISVPDCYPGYERRTGYQCQPVLPAHGISYVDKRHLRPKTYAHDGSI